LKKVIQYGLKYQVLRIVTKRQEDFADFFILFSDSPALPGEVDPKRFLDGFSSPFHRRGDGLFGPSHKSLIDFACILAIYVRFNVQ
jgi:hypothetical protein